MAAPARAVLTSDRLLAAATELFAQRGFHGTSIRQIAERAGANVAAGHYHYGSKKGLYLQVLRDQFAHVRATLARHGAPTSRRTLRASSRRELIALLTHRIEAMIAVLLKPPLQPHGALMLREMCDPTTAMPIIVREFIRPQTNEMAAIVACLLPRAPHAAVERSVRSIVGQVLFYRFTMPALLLQLGRPAYPPRFAREIAAHILEFSLGGLARVGRARRTRARVAHPRRRVAHPRRTDRRPPARPERRTRAR
jgi:AcrR family transcriptional regulator